MSFEQPFYSFSYPGEPPTPTRTPTSPNFFLNSLQTPKQDSRSHGPFSPWSPTYPSAISPNLRTPVHVNVTPTKSPVKSFVGQDLQSEIASHEHHLTPGQDQTLAPVEPSRRLSSSPNPTPNSESKRRRLGTDETTVAPQKLGLDTRVGHSVNPAGSMQTPPPTSTSASRRKSQQVQGARAAKGSGIEDRRASSPSHRKRDGMDAQASHVDESPQHFAPLQFSPEGFGFPMSGPATAPVYPQHKLFWDPDQGGDVMNVDFPMDDTFTAFSTGLQKTADPLSTIQDPSFGLHFPSSPGFDLSSARNDNIAAFSTSGNLHSTGNTVTSSLMTRKPSRGVAVDPSLLFSSPSNGPQVSSEPPRNKMIHNENLLPYAHQLRDARIEMELQMQNSKKSKRKRGAECDSPAVKAALETLRDDQSVVKREGLDSSVAQLADHRTSSRSSNGHSKGPGAMEGSLHKKRSKSSLQTHEQTSQMQKRTSVTLTIDANGRAKTETKVVSSRPNSSHMQVDHASEDSDDTSSSSSDGSARSQRRLSAYTPVKQNKPKLGRFRNDVKSHSQKSLYASTLGSGNVTKTFSDKNSRRPSSNLFMQINAHDQRRGSSGHINNEGESEAETIVDSGDDRGDAQSELKKVLRSRSQKRSNKRLGWSDSKNAPMDHRRPHLSRDPPVHPHFVAEDLTPRRHGYSDTYNEISPTTITDPDLAAPSSNQSTLSSDSVRCICHGIEDDGQPMIQCESCRKWQHMTCLGIPFQRMKIPRVHLCIFCTGSTPNVRAGRVRQPNMAAFPPPPQASSSSPLAHKSQRY